MQAPITFYFLMRQKQKQLYTYIPIFMYIWLKNNM